MARGCGKMWLAGYVLRTFRYIHDIVLIHIRSQRALRYILTLLSHRLILASWSRGFSCCDTHRNTCINTPTQVNEYSRLKQMNKTTTTTDKKKLRETKNIQSIWGSLLFVSDQYNLICCIATHIE